MLIKYLVLSIIIVFDLIHFNLLINLLNKLFYYLLDISFKNLSKNIFYYFIRNKLANAIFHLGIYKLFDFII